MMRPICQQTDLVEPICTGLCTDGIRPETVVKPLAGGQTVVTPVEPFDPAPPGLIQRDLNLSADTRGNPLGTAGVQGGSDAFSSSAAGGAASR
ncbi:hypothetical protein MKL09_19290 [Methylobacterium sp. J-048]|nr:hypothetical protein [Methylobacterium sp. J-048]